MEKKQKQQNSMHIICPVQVSGETTTTTVEVCFTRLPFSPWKPKKKKTKQKQEENVYLQFLSTSTTAMGRIAHFLYPCHAMYVYTYVSTIGREECRFFVRSRMLFFLSLEFSFTLAPRPTSYSSAAVIMAAFAVPVTKLQARTIC